MAALAVNIKASFRPSCAYFLTKLPPSSRCLYNSVRNTSSFRKLRTIQNCTSFGRHLRGDGYTFDRSRFAVGALSQPVRWNGGSTTAAATQDILSNLPPGYIPEPPAPVPGAGMEDFIGELTALGEPSLRSLGLGGWSPFGLVQSGLEAIHVSLDVPWWTAIVIGTCIVRVVMFPLVILAQRNAANMHNHMPIFQKLQEKFTRARQSGNPLEAARAGQKMSEYMKKYDVNPLKSAAVPFLQLPVFICVFVGVRRMANLPVESMTVGGLAWFTDLTIADPYYALPLLTMATFLITLELGVDGVKAASMTNTMRFAMRAMPFVIFPFTMNFPAAMLCYWLTSNLISLVQVSFLKIPQIRQFFKIPDLVLHDTSVTKNAKKPFIKSLKDSYRNSKMAVDVDAIQRSEATKFKEAGLGAVPKTYSFDPTKVKRKSDSQAK